MISAVRKTSDVRDRGFTLLEMVVVLSLTMLVIGGALSALYFNRDEAKLTDATQSIEVLAKRARTVATLQQRPYALEFFDHTVSLMPFAEAVMEVGDREMMIESMDDGAMFEDGESVGAAPRPSIVRDAWVAEPEMSMQIKRWATNEWVPLNQHERHVWRFDPDGICEPVAVRVEVDGSWSEIVFHPLTAAIADSQSEIR